MLGTDLFGVCGVGEDRLLPTKQENTTAQNRRRRPFSIRENSLVPCLRLIMAWNFERFLAERDCSIVHVVVFGTD